MRRLQLHSEVLKHVRETSQGSAHTSGRLGRKRTCGVERFCQEHVWETLAAGIESFLFRKRMRGLAEADGCS